MKHGNTLSVCVKSTGDMFNSTNTDIIDYEHLLVITITKMDCVTITHYSILSFTVTICKKNIQKP